MSAEASDIAVFDAESERMVPARVSPAMSRRRLIQLATSLGVGLSLGVLDLIGQTRRKPADAADYEYWTDCHGYASASEICVPTTAYFGSDNCDDYLLAHFHRKDQWRQVNGVYWGWYTHNGTSCSGRNAWIWRGGSTTSAQAMCSDGYKTTYDTSTWNVVFSSFSICRTPPP